MKTKEKSRFRWGPESGNAKERFYQSIPILRLYGFPVNSVFSCGFLYEVYAMLSQPVTIEQLARMTDSTVDRVRLALSDLQAAGVQIGRAYNDR